MTMIVFDFADIRSRMLGDDKALPKPPPKVTVVAGGYGGARNFSINSQSLTPYTPSQHYVIEAQKLTREALLEQVKAQSAQIFAGYPQWKFGQ